MKRVISLILAAVILGLSLTVGAVNIAPKVKAVDIDYQCGDNITWSLDTATGVLRLDGTGETYDYSKSRAPWFNYATYIKSIVILLLK